MYTSILHVGSVHRTARYRCDQTTAIVGAYPAGSATGYLYADPSLDEGLIMLEGVQTTGDGSVTAWLTNTTDFSMSIEAEKPLRSGNPIWMVSSSLLTRSTTK